MQIDAAVILVLCGDEVESLRHTSFSRSGFNEALPKPDKP
jgi:hypothetical protein